MNKKCIRHRFIVLFCFIVLFFCKAVFSRPRTSSEPYLSGDTFRKICNHVIDKENRGFDPKKVCRGDTIFIGTGEPDGNLDHFFRVLHPKIQVPYILVTHNGDMNVPGKYVRYLDDEKLFAWFGQNSTIAHHKKFIPIPIGLENTHWGRPYVQNIKAYQERRGHSEKREFLLLMNFAIGTNPGERKMVFELFHDKSFCFASSLKKLDEYMADVCHAKFLLSPHGNGLDCHRTWEALYLGAIPIVKRSTLDKLYDKLPVLIINDWQQITKEFLETTYHQMQAQEYQLNRLYLPYWKELIGSYQAKCRTLRKRKK